MFLLIFKSHFYIIEKEDWSSAQSVFRHRETGPSRPPLLGISTGCCRSLLSRFIQSSHWHKIMADDHEIIGSASEFIKGETFYINLVTSCFIFFKKKIESMKDDLFMNFSLSSNGMPYFFFSRWHIFIVRKRNLKQFSFFRVILKMSKVLKVYFIRDFLQL